MKRFTFVGVVLLLALAAWAGEVKKGSPTGTSQPVGGVDTAGKVYPLSVTDAGVLSVSITGAGASGGAGVTVSPSAGHWDCVTDPVGYCASTGATNNGVTVVDAGSYVKGQCNVATYIGNTTVYNVADAGNPPACYQSDAGYNPTCRVRGANEVWYLDLRNTSRNAVGCTSVSGAASCSVSTCVN